MIPGARLILLGRQGAGKGTQCVRLSRHFVVPHISTGDIFRANVRDETPLGVEAKGFMDRGEYVPDSLTNALVADRLTHDDCAPGFLLDRARRLSIGIRAGGLCSSNCLLERLPLFKCRQASGLRL